MADPVDRVAIDSACLTDDFKSISLKRWKSISRKILEGAPSEPLQGELLEGCERITSGTHRAVFEVFKEGDGYSWAWVIEVAHRDSVYDEPKIAKRRFRS